MTRRLFTALLGLPLFAQQHRNLHVRVTIPHMGRSSVIGILSEFFSRGDQVVKKKFEEVIGQAGNVTLVVTTLPAPDGTNTIQIEILRNE